MSLDYDDILASVGRCLVPSLALTGVSDEAAVLPHSRVGALSTLSSGQERWLWSFREAVSELGQ
jgi:hypothetical protein